ncbi:hypothetical protein [Hydrogenophaga sp. OTU3427]|uniref:hypothetical protein n=1 Tax=Hydrogenophaga sp. OTU3427 TaxID=3043856 RepID=UPI00313C2D4F
MRSSPGCLAWLALALCATQASAMSIRELRAIEQLQANGDLHAQYYLIGVMEGALEANAMAQRNGRKPLFCLQGRRLTPQTAASLYRAELLRNEGVYEADMPVELVMTNALSSSYRCAD